MEQEGVQPVGAFVGAAPGAGLWDVEEVEEAAAGVEVEEEAAAGVVEADAVGADAWVDDDSTPCICSFLVLFFVLDIG